MVYSFTGSAAALPGHVLARCTHRVERRERVSRGGMFLCRNGIKHSL
jgi:hypothetical protein